jgi:hypothetical protein
MGIVYWSPSSIFVSLNKEQELEGGEPKFMFLFCLLGGGGGGFENFTCLKRGQRKNIITVEFLLSLPLYNK